jgi:hypothetical protein
MSPYSINPPGGFGNRNIVAGLLVLQQVPSPENGGDVFIDFDIRAKRCVLHECFWVKFRIKPMD